MNGPPRGDLLRVGLVAHELTDERGRGLQAYTRGLATALERSGAVEVVYFSRSPLAASAKHLTGHRETWMGSREFLWEQRELPRRARRLGVNVLHAPGNRGLPAFAPCPTVLTRHDEIERTCPPDFPRSFKSDVRRRYADFVSVRAAARIVAVSATSARAVAREWPDAASKIVVAGEGIDDRFFEAVPAADIARVRSAYRLTGDYVCYLGGFERRKSVDVLVNAFESMTAGTHRLVLAGHPRGLADAVRARVERLVSAGRAALLGFVPDQDVAPLVGGAVAFAFPSSHEGFGLPVAEAMALGTPVICSNEDALSEVTQGAARVFEAGDVEDCRRALEEVLGDAQLRSRMAEDGRGVAQQYAWARVLPRYLDLYRSII